MKNPCATDERVLESTTSANAETIQFRPIGIIHSEHVTPQNTPIQPVYARGCRGRAEIFSEFAAGLRDLDGFSHVYLIYHFDRAPQPALCVKPFLQDVERGVFSTRHPGRPNPIGLSIVELLSCDGHTLVFDGADILDGTPLIDIKPYSLKFDHIVPLRNGWQDEIDGETASRRGLRGFRRDE